MPVNAHRLRVVAGVLALGAAFALPARADDVATIVAVWRAPLSCEGVNAASLSPDPAAEAIARGRLVDIPGAPLQFHVPPLAGVDRLSLRMTVDDRRRGVSDTVLQLAAADTAPPVAAVVVTPMPKHVDTAAKAFEIARDAERRMAQGTGLFPVFDVSDGPYGETLEMRVPGRATSPCYPLDRFVAGRLDGQATVGISRFVFVKGRLVEFALQVAMPAAMTLDDQQAKAQAAMERFWAGLSPL